MGLVSISFYKSYFYFILFWVFEFSSTFIKEALDAIYADHINVNLLFELINVVCFNISDLLAGFLVLITCITSKSSQSTSISKKKTKESLESSLIFSAKSNSPRNKYKLILLISTSELIARFIDFFFFVIFGNKRIRSGEISWLISLDFLSRMIFSHYLLKYKIFKHHILTISCIVVSLCTMSICAFIALGNVDGKNWPHFISLGLKFIIISLEDVLNKIVFNKKFLLPHTLMFLRGIFNALMFLILIPLIIFIKNNKQENLFKLEHINEENNMDIGIQIFLVILYIFFISFKIFCIMKVIYIFSPQYVSFLNEVYYLFLLFRCRLRADDNKFIVITDVFCFIIIISSTLVFNEILILNFCGLNKHTKDVLKLKESKEIEDINTSLENEGNEEKMNKSVSDSEDSNELQKSSFEDSADNHEF